MEELMPACTQGLGDTAQNQAFVPEKPDNAVSLFFLSLLCENDKNNNKKQNNNKILLGLHCLHPHGWP